MTKVEKQTTLEWLRTRLEVGRILWVDAHTIHIPIEELIQWVVNHKASDD